nr:polyphenol oxidase family protein [Bombiscardovia apis]
MVDSTAGPQASREGLPIPVTIPIDLAPGIKVVYTTRLGGSSQGDFASFNLGARGGDDFEAVAANRLALSAAVGAPLALVSQVHSGRAVDVDAFGPDRARELAELEADGLVSAQSNLALGVFAADCLPVLLADAEAGVIAAAHCGRRGLEQGIIGSTVERMLAQGAHAGSIVATLGPAICADCYELGESLAASFEHRFPATASHTRFGGPGADLSLAARQELEAAGVEHLVDSNPRLAAATQYLVADPELEQLCASDGEGPSLEERMADLRHPRCTLENPLWYSHRRASLAGKPREGRMLALIVREG